MMRAALISTSVAATAGIAAPAFADWGGVAVNEGAPGWGYSAGWNTKKQARDRAMHYCREFSGGQAGCSVVMTTQKCGAVVRNDARTTPRFFVANANTKAGAEKQAMSQCSATAGAKCNLRKAFCADDL